MHVILLTNFQSLGPSQTIKHRWPNIWDVCQWSNVWPLFHDTKHFSVSRICQGKSEKPKTFSAFLLTANKIDKHILRWRSTVKHLRDKQVFNVKCLINNARSFGRGLVRSTLLPPHLKARKVWVPRLTVTALLLNGTVKLLEPREIE